MSLEEISTSLDLIYEKLTLLSLYSNENANIPISLIQIKYKVPKVRNRKTKNIPQIDIEVEIIRERNVYSKKIYNNEWIINSNNIKRKKDL